MNRLNGIKVSVRCLQGVLENPPLAGSVITVSMLAAIHRANEAADILDVRGQILKSLNL